MSDAVTKHLSRAEVFRIIIGSSLGTVIEWYDFFLFASIGSTIAPRFYDTKTALGNVIALLGAFAIGFVFRPIGAVLFGFLGDRTGRKKTFLITLFLMGTCTTLIGCLPTIDMIGPTAGVLLIVLRVVQGLALGGEYGGAATYVAEHSPIRKRGYYTSYLQTTAAIGYMLSLIVILICQKCMSGTAFTVWGWRIPFLLSIFLVGASLYIRMKMDESPIFQALKAEGKVARNPFAKCFTRYNLRAIAIGTIGATLGQGVVSYTGLLYTLFYLQTIFKLPAVDANVISVVAAGLSSPVYVLVGWLSDRYGRKIFIQAGLILAIVTLYPIYLLMNQYRYYTDSQALTLNPNYNPYMLCFLVWVQMLYGSISFGSMAAFLVELYPTNVRYTALSVAQTLGAGIFGGIVPLVGLSLINATGNQYAGIWYPLGASALCLIVNIFFVPETFRNDITLDVPSEDKTQFDSSSVEAVASI
ncbi:major facilitator family transporter [Polychytrium aggregatum]|uniref:major facilitator family transporter n=1 Tax=Polychytrium aggregatum TaxID=110093 RepID=UPI0022FE3A9F|nr:major facilitator family transporter [Polychytrium aggregatum]KAI9208352.1 major facilitator family transporter [Polychytrium aggregatum]